MCVFNSKIAQVLTWWILFDCQWISTQETLKFSKLIFLLIWCAIKCKDEVESSVKRALYFHTNNSLDYLQTYPHSFSIRWIVTLIASVTCPGTTYQFPRSVSLGKLRSLCFSDQLFPLAKSLPLLWSQDLFEKRKLDFQYSQLNRVQPVLPVGAGWKKGTPIRSLSIAWNLIPEKRRQGWEMMATCPSWGDTITIDQ